MASGDLRANPGGKGRIVVIGVATVAALGAGYLFWQWYSGRDLALSTAPERRVAGVDIPDSDSDIALRIKVPLALLRSAVNSAIPSSFSKDENGPDICKKILFQDVCVGTKYEFAANRGSVAIGKEGNALKVATHIDISGKGGFRGDGASILGLNAKNFDAAADLSGLITLSVAPDWCPVVGLATSYNWTKSPRVEIVGGVWIGVEGLVSGSINDALKGLPDKVRDAIPCDTIRGEVRNAWRNYIIPVAIPGGPPVYVGIQPKSLALSPLIVADDEVRLSILLRAATSLSTAKGAEAPIADLPNVQPAADAPGRLQVTLPVRLGYAALREELLRRFGNQDFAFKVDGKDGKLRVKDVELYPSGESLAIGLTFSADLPGRAFDVSGKVYMTATPVVDAQGTQLRLQDVKVRRDIDNGLWRALSVAFEGLIQEQITKAGVVDLSPRSQEAIRAMNEAIADPAKTGGVRLIVKDASIGLKRVAPQADNLLVTGLFSATVESELVSVPK